MVAIVVAGLTVSYAPSIQSYLDFNPTSVRFKMEFKKLEEAGMVKYPSLTTAKVETKSSSIFIEDPLLKTEDVIKADSENELINEASVKTVPVVKPAAKKAEEKPIKTTSSGFGGFSGFKDTTPAKTEPTKTDGFSDGFGDTKTEPKTEPAKEDAFSGGFGDTKFESKTEEKKAEDAVADEQSTETEVDADADADADADIDDTTAAEPADTDESKNAGGFDDF